MSVSINITRWPSSVLIVCRQGRDPCCTPQATNSIAAPHPPLFTNSCKRLSRRCGLSPALAMWLDASTPPRKCLQDRVSYLCGLNASRPKLFADVGRQSDPFLALPTQDAGSINWRLPPKIASVVVDPGMGEHAFASPRMLVAWKRSWCGMEEQTSRR